MTAATVAAAPPDTGLVQRRLRVLRQRLLVQRFLDCLGQCLLGGAGVLLALGVTRFLHGAAPWSSGLAAGVLAGSLLAAAASTVFGGLSLAQTAAVIDARARTHDRFHTALAFAARPVRTPLEDLTLAECARFVVEFPVRRWTPAALPRQFLYVPVPLIALGLLSWHAALGIGRPPRDPALDAAVDHRAHALDQLADKVRRADAPPEAKPALDKIADEMKKSAERLKQASDQNDPEKLRTALKELSSLEAMLNAMKQAAREQKVSPAELQALAAALAANPQTQQVAEALQQGDLAQAGNELEKLLEQLKQQQGGDAEKTLSQLAQSMQEQAAKLSEQERNELARQMQQAGQGAQSNQPQLSEEALKKLADLLRKKGQNGQGKGGQKQASNGGQNGQPMTEKQLQDLINALENMKDGMQPENGDPKEGQGGGQSLSLMEEFGKKPGGDSSPDGKPGGMPGSDHDPGHPEKLFSDKAEDAAKTGEAHRIEGMLGEGESLQQLTGTTGGPAKAGRRYKELYDAMAPAAQDSVEQENIPLGSRHFVKQYFENIRPQN